MKTLKVVSMITAANLMCSSITADCPEAFHAFGSSCYYFAGGPRLNFDDARSFCKGMGADLPVIETQVENDYLAEMNGENQRAWLLAGRHADNG